MALTTPRRLATLAHLLAEQAEARADQVALRFLEPGARASTDSDVTELTFSQLHREATLVAAHLESVAEPGDRALLLCPPGPAYVAALFGCFYAGVVAVPAYPPMTAGVDERLRLLFADSAPRAILTTELLAPLCANAGIDDLAHSAGASMMVLDALGPSESSFEARWSKPEDLALLQYTSGSTGNPRGVMLSHLNILANVDAIVAHAAGTAEDRGVFWLPPYHDMGLIGGIFTPIVEGAETTLMSPLSFLADPLVWLDAITRYRATFSAAPNFAYELCTRKATDVRIAALDLESWRIVINGAEPVRSTTMRRFAERFAPAGFHSSCFMPCYGLAEATLLVAGTRVGHGVKTTHLSSAKSSPADTSATPPAGEAVSSGTPAHGSLVLVVDPTARTPCAEGEVGEIWFQGPSVARGYWNGERENDALFRAELAGDPATGAPAPGPFLRTGDLGVWHAGELYVTGRSKDVIIVRGQNHYPHDIENTLGNAGAGLRPGCIAVFQAPENTDEHGRESASADYTTPAADHDHDHDHDHDAQNIIAVAETTAAANTTDIQEIALTARRAVANEHGLSLTELVLIERGTSLKTSSGKIRRRPTREAYLSGTLVVQAVSGASTNGSAQPSDQHNEDVQALLTAAIAEILGLETVLPGDDFLALGGDSLNAVELVAAVGERGLAIEPTDIYQFPTALLLSEELRRRGTHEQDAPGKRSALLTDLLRGEIPRVPSARSYPLSPIQRRWAADYLGDRSKTWGNLTLRMALPDGGDPSALEAAVNHLWSTHEALRTVFPEQDGELRQRVLDSVTVPIGVHDLRDLPVEERAAATSRIAAAEAASVFDLAQGPSARLALVRTGEGSSEIVLTLHHMLADGWSVMELREQLADAYSAAATAAPMASPTTADTEASTTTPPLAPEIRYRDYAAWMNRLEEQDALNDARRYWLQELDGEIPVTLPVKERAARGEDTRGASHLVVLPSELSASLRAQASASRCSISALLLGAFFLAIQRRTGARDLIVGTPLAGRDRQDIRKVIGMFINLVPIRLRFQRDWELGDVVEATHEKLVGALTHQRYQLDNILRDLDIEREPHCFPITNVFFTKMSMGKQTIGPQTGASNAGDLPIDVRYQMMLYAYDFADGLVIDCRYRKVLFAAADVAELVEQYTAILAARHAGPTNRMDA